MDQFAFFYMITASPVVPAPFVDILAQKLRIPKIQFAKPMKLKRKTKVWILRSFLEGGTKYPWKELQRQSVKQRRKE